MTVVVLALAGTAAAEQPPRVRVCSAAVVGKDLLTINCPKARLGDLLAALRERIGMEADVSDELAATPVSVVLEKSTLQVALDTMLARYNYSLDGTPVIIDGRAAATRVVVLGPRETAAQDNRNPPPMDVAPPSAEPAPSRYLEEPPAPADTADSRKPQPAAPEAPAGEAPAYSTGMPAIDSERAAKAREAFFANLPAPGATLPPAPARVELPPSLPIQNSTGPGDGRRGLPLPDFTPGPPTRTPPGTAQ
ncbi:MAG: hypothetical protein IPL03_03360 [Sterolibacteriaceae bacterium]|nr:hypothetical protein [Candidatus Methylophosphatis haderslevensis]